MNYRPQGLWLQAGAAMAPSPIRRIPMSEQPRQSVSQRTVIGVIVGGLVAWAIYAAVGTYLESFDPWRAVIVLGCMAAFVGFWLLLLWGQARRRRNER